eukprot:GFYU01004597.1.p1 GENE.GFYU01004597.1~~GFYU01004597.1.p1  ORF type:complete len:239 (-),score=56.75 GFYU01004597.1:287-1003(-)
MVDLPFDLSFEYVCYVGVALLVLSALWFQIQVRVNEGFIEFWVLNYFASIVGALFYLSMAMGQGVIVKEGGVAVLFNRNLLVLVTSPLTLLSILLLIRASKTTIGVFMGMDILKGFALTVGSTFSNSYLCWAWGVVGTLFTLTIVAMLRNQVGKAAQSQAYPVAMHFRSLAFMAAFGWLFFPVMWIVGPEGMGLLGTMWQAVMQLIVDLWLKIVLGLRLTANRGVFQYVGTGPNYYPV